jgi:hypothetical protein
MALEAFAGRNDFSGDAKVDDLHRAVDILAPLIPPICCTAQAAVEEVTPVDRAVVGIPRHAREIEP